MRDVKGALRIIAPYLPRGAKVLELGTYYNTMAIDEQDLNGNGYKEVIVLYSYEGENYLLVLERDKRRWAIVWNKTLMFTEIVYFKIEKIINTYTKQVIIGGKKGMADSRYTLDILSYTDDGVVSILEQPIYFHKIDTQEVENRVQIIVWEHIKLEAYDINVYRYEDERMCLGGWDESLYFRSVVGYYRYLSESYPTEDIYQQCLDEAVERVNGKNSTDKASLSQLASNLYLEDSEKEVAHIQIEVKQEINKEEEDQTLNQVIVDENPLKDMAYIHSVSYEEEITNQDQEEVVEEVVQQVQHEPIDSAERGCPLQQTQMSEMQKQEDGVQVQQGNEELRIMIVYEPQGKMSELYITGQKVPNSNYLSNLHIIWHSTHGKQVIYYNTVDQVEYSLFLSPLRNKEQDDIILTVRLRGDTQPAYKIFVKDKMIYKEISDTIQRDETMPFRLYYVWDEITCCYKIVNVIGSTHVQVMDIVEDALVVRKSVSIY